MVLAVCDWRVKVLPVKKYWRVAQQVEHLAVNQGVVGPSPTVPADVFNVNTGDV